MDEAPRPTRKRTWRRRLMPWIFTFLIAYAAWLVLALMIQRTMLYPRWIANQRTLVNPEQAIPGLERSWIDIGNDARVEVWFVPGDGVSADKPGPAVMLAHGNGELIDNQGPVIEDYTRRGVSVMLCEYRGYGRSDGSPSQRGIVDDFLIAYDRLVERPEVDADRIILHGRSLGTGVLSQLASQRMAAAVILRSPFYSVRSMMRRYGVWGPFVLDPFDSASALQQYDGPVLIMHGNRDSVIPINQGRALHEAIDDSTFIEFDADHNDFPEGGRKYWDAIETLLREAEVMRNEES